jgi:hypothetical protein
VRREEKTSDEKMAGEMREREESRRLIIHRARDPLPVTRPSLPAAPRVLYRRAEVSAADYLRRLVFVPQ